MQLSRCFFAYLIEAAFDCESVRKRIARLLFHFDRSRSDAWKFLQCCFCVLKTSRDYGVFSSLFQQTSLCLSNTYELCARCVFVFSHFYSQTTDDDEIQFFFVLWRAQLKKKIFNLLLVSRISSPTKRIYLCKEEEVDEPNSTKSKSCPSGWESCVLWAHLEVLIAVEKWTVLCCDEVTQSLSLSLPLLHNAQQRYNVVSVVRMSLFSDFLHKNSITLAEWAFNKHKIYAVKYTFLLCFDTYQHITSLSPHRAAFFLCCLSAGWLPPCVWWKTPSIISRSHFLEQYNYFFPERLHFRFQCKPAMNVFITRKIVYLFYVGVCVCCCFSSLARLREEFFC